MGKPNVFQTEGFQLTNTTFRAYVQDDATGTNIVPSTVSAIAYTVTKAMSPRQKIKTADAVAITPVATYLAASLSLTGWDVDQVGYNFQFTIPGACFPDAGDYVVDFIGTLAADSSTFVLAKCFHHSKSRT